MKTQLSFLLGVAIYLLIASTVQAMKPSSKLRLQPHIYHRPPLDDKVETPPPPPPPPYYPCQPPPPPPPSSSSDCCSMVWNRNQFHVPENRCPQAFVEGLVCALNVQRALRDLKPLRLSYDLSREAAYWAHSVQAHRARDEVNEEAMNRQERRYAQAFWRQRRLAPCYGPMEARASQVVGYWYQQCTNFRPVISDGYHLYSVSDEAWNATSQVGVGCDTWVLPNQDQKMLVTVYFDHPRVRKDLQPDMEATNEEMAKQVEKDKSLAEEDDEEASKVDVPQLEGKKKEVEEKEKEEGEEKKEEEKEEEEKEEEEEEKKE